MSIPTITAKELAAICKDCPVELIDVRTPAEYAAVRVPFAKLAPLDKLDPHAVFRERATADQPLYVICRSGSRAKQACEQFRAAGFDNVVCVDGGTLAWEQEGLEVVKGRRQVLPLDRQMRIVIGSFIVLSAILTWLVHPAFVALCVLGGAGLIFAGATDICPLSMTLARMPWNRAGDGATCGLATR